MSDSCGKPEPFCLFKKNTRYRNSWADKGIYKIYISYEAFSM